MQSLPAAAPPRPVRQPGMMARRNVRSVPAGNLTVSGPNDLQCACPIERGRFASLRGRLVPLEPALVTTAAARWRQVSASHAHWLLPCPCQASTLELPTTPGRLAPTDCLLALHRPHRERQRRGSCPSWKSVLRQGQP